MGLPWVRLDSNIATHDKVIAAREHPKGKQAMCLYMFALAWSGGAGTDGHIPRAAVSYLRGTPTEIAVLVEAGLWESNGDGWNIRNFAQRQETEAVTDQKRHDRRISSLRANCVRWHGPDCGCWKTEQ